MKTSIIIPAHNHWEYTEQCIAAIDKYTTGYEILLMDNGSDAPITYADVGDLSNGELIIVRSKRNIGFPAACNLGANASDGELICFLNNDTVVTPDWLDHLKFFIESDMLDVVGPVTNNIYGHQQIITDIYNNDDELNVVAKSIYELNKQQCKRLYRLTGFCMLMKRTVWDAAGPFDPDEIYGLGNFEDDDFCLTAIDKGFRLGYALDTFIHHYGSITCSDMGSQLKKLLDRNHALFTSRWPSERVKELIEKNGG